MGEAHGFCIILPRDDISTLFRCHGSFANSPYKGVTIGGTVRYWWMYPIEMYVIWTTLQLAIRL